MMMISAQQMHMVVPDAGSRREALDIGISQDDMTREVSQEEIAAALAKSMADQFSAPAPSVNPPMPGLPPPGMPPAGMPPLGKVPLGMPPVIQQKPLPITPQPVPAKSSAQSGPPLPASGLPAGWSMAQWQAYGHMWLEKNQP